MTTFLQRWILSWVRLGEAIVGILTLGFVNLSFSTGLLIHFMAANCPKEDDDHERD